MLSRLREQTRRIRESRKARRRVRACLAEITHCYDFENFTLEGFAGWVEEQRGCSIRFIPRPMPARVSGAWMTWDGSDFIFYPENVLPSLQAQIQLHELSHILAGHPTLDLDTPKGRAFFGLLSAQVSAESSLSGAGRMRSTHSDQEEMEAEEIAALIRRKAQQHANLHQLTSAVPGEFAEFFSDYLASIEMDT